MEKSASTMAISAACNFVRSSSHHAIGRSLHSYNRCMHHPLRLASIRFFSTNNNDDRIQGIQMNPSGFGNKILPGNQVIKVVRDEERKIMTERAFGNFWMMSDLKKTNNKPILTNDTIIPTERAQVFPFLPDWIPLQPDSCLENVPDFFVRNNRADDATAQCTLVAIAYKQYGAQMLASWTEPFQQAFRGNSRVEVVHLNITEGWFLSKLQGYLTSSARKNTPQEEWPTTLLHYASNTDDPSLMSFKDILRMHNTLTAYVYLLDGLGRVRCAGSGKASQEEANRMIQFAKDLVPALQDGKNTKKERKPHRRR